jgi:hypothetical protein
VRAATCSSVIEPDGIIVAIPIPVRVHIERWRPTRSMIIAARRAESRGDNPSGENGVRGMRHGVTDRSRERESAISAGARGQCARARCRDKAARGDQNGLIIRHGGSLQYRGRHTAFRGGLRTWRNQSPMTGRRSVIACSKSSRKSLHLSNLAQDAKVAAGSPPMGA